MLSSYTRDLAYRRGMACGMGMREDFLQDAAVAQLEGIDPYDAVRYAYHRWRFGQRGHRRATVTPVWLGPPRDNDLTTPSPENMIADRELLMKIWQIAGMKARAAMVANYLGAPYVWRPEIKTELLTAARSLLGESL